MFFLDGRDVILIGDFNCVLNTRTDVQGPGWGRSAWNSRELRRLVHHFSLLDAHNVVHGNTFVWTWRRGRSSSRLDRAYIPRALEAFVSDLCVPSFPPSPVYVSDHRPIVLKLEVPFSFSEKPWRLDVRVLQDARSRSDLSRAIRVSLTASGPEDWDALKTQWRLRCAVEGRSLRRRVSEELADTAMKLRIALRAETPSPLMRAWQRELRERFQRLTAASSLAAAAWRCRHNPCAHPEVLRYARHSFFWAIRAICLYDSTNTTCAEASYA